MTRNVLPILTVATGVLALLPVYLNINVQDTNDTKANSEILKFLNIATIGAISPMSFEFIIDQLFGSTSLEPMERLTVFISLVLPPILSIVTDTGNSFTFCAICGGELFLRTVACFSVMTRISYFHFSKFSCHWLALVLSLGLILRQFYSADERHSWFQVGFICCMTFFSTIYSLLVVTWFRFLKLQYQSQDGK